MHDRALRAGGAADGLGTGAQASLASYPQVVRRHCAVPDDHRLLCGVSIGRPAAAPENRFRPGAWRSTRCSCRRL